MAPPAAYSRSRHIPALRYYSLVLSAAAFVFTISSSFSSLSVVPCSAISAASSDSVLSQSQSHDDDRAVLLLRGMGRRSLLGMTEDDESDSESLLLVPNKINNNNKKKKQQQQQEPTSSTTNKSMKTTPPSSSSTKKSSKNQTKLIKPSSTSSGLSSSPSLSKSMSSNNTKLMKPTNLESSSEDDSSLSEKTTMKLNTTSSKGSDSLKMKSTPSTKKFSSSSDLLKTSGSTNTKSQSDSDNNNNNKKKKQLSTSNKSKDTTNDETKSKKNNSSKLSISSSHSSSSSSSSAKTRVKKEQTNAQKSKEPAPPTNWLFQEDEDSEDDFISEFRELPTRFHKTFVPDLHRISTTSKLYLSQTAKLMTRDLKPYVGHKYASTMATAVSFSFILLPLLLVSLLFNRIIRSYSSLQKILIFIHVYLSIYFSILSLSDLVTGLEPLKFFYAASRSSYVWLQVLQTLAYVFYLLLLLMYLILVFGAESGLASKFLALAQTFVGFAVGLHYYVAVFHRVVLHQPPKTNWKVHGIYALSFLLISFCAGADRRKKKAYLNHDGGGEQGKNS